MAYTNDRTFRAHIEMLESWEQGRDLRAAPARWVATIIGARRFGQHGRLLRRRWRDPTRRRRARRQGLNQISPAHAVFGLFGLAMLGHLSLTHEFQQRHRISRVIRLSGR